MDAAVKARVAQVRIRKERQTELAAMAAVHGRAAAQAAAADSGAHSAAVAAALEALQAAAARRAVASLAAEDPDDLYFKDGESASELPASLVRAAQSWLSQY